MWCGVFDIIAGLMSLYFPLTISAHDKNDLTNSNSNDDDDVDTKYGGNQADNNDKPPVFDISVPFLERNNFITHCCILQVVSGIMIISAAYGMGSHIFSRFLLGCTWMAIRILILIFEFTLINHLFKSQHGPLMRYTYFVSLHAAVDIYFFIVIRYYTMECYDSYRYQNIMRSLHLQIRREPPTSSKSAPKTRSGIGKQKKRAKGRKRSQPESDKNVEQVRDIFQKRRDLETGVERVPVWDRKNEVIFYGEDYTDWDPSVFQARWEMLNEKDKAEKMERAEKSSKSSRRHHALEYLSKAKSINERNLVSTVSASEHFGERSGRSHSANMGSSTLGASEHFNQRQSREHSTNKRSTIVGPENFGRRSKRSQSANNITRTHQPKVKEEEIQEVDNKFHWSSSRQQYQPQPFHPVIQRPPKRSTRNENSVLHKFRKEANEKKQ